MCLSAPALSLQLRRASTEGVGWLPFGNTPRASAAPLAAPFSSAEFWTDDYAVGIRLEWEDGECIYCLNPSSSGDSPDVFLYRGTPEDGTPILHVNVGLSPKESDDA